MALTQKQPDIGYQPDFQNYQLRVEKLKPQRPPVPSLPAGFPAQLDGGLVWEGSDFASEKDWTLSLSKGQLEEVEQALRHFRGE